MWHRSNICYYKICELQVILLLTWSFNFCGKGPVYSCTVTMESFTFDSVIRGHHVYREAKLGKNFCRWDRSNSPIQLPWPIRNCYSNVGHVPRKISAICYVFLRKPGAFNYYYRIKFCEVSVSSKICKI